MSDYTCNTCRFFEKNSYGDGLCNWARVNWVLPYWIEPVKFKIHVEEYSESDFVCPTWRERDKEDDSSLVNDE